MTRLVSLAVIAVAVALSGRLDAQGCTSVRPGADWVCVAGGWLPPGATPAPPVVTPAPTTPPTQGSGSTVPGQLQWMGGTFIGETVELSLAELPLSIRPVDGRNVHRYAGKVLTAPASYQGPITIIESLGTIKFPLFNLPNRMVVEDLTVAGKPGQDCMWLAAHNTRLTRPFGVGCDNALRVIRSVNVAVNDATLAGTVRGLWLDGTEPGMNLQGGGETELSITTFSMTDSRITRARESAIRLEHGRAITLDRVIVEGNPGAALLAIPDWRGDLSHVVLRDSWQEANGQGIYDPRHVVSVQGGGAW